jgi:hydrogenase maturation factor
LDNHYISKQKLSQLCTKRSRELADSPDSIICLDDIYNEDNSQTTNSEIEPVKVASIDGINLSSEENVRLSAHVVENQQPCQIPRQTGKKCQTAVSNKKFKCAECFFRSNKICYVTQHFQLTHRQAVFNTSQFFQKLDEDEATRTLTAYEQNYASYKMLCKWFKCGKCEFRTTHRFNAYNHMCRVHQVEYNEAKRTVDALQLNEAENTSEKAINRKFKCAECHYRSNWSMCVTRHFRMAHPQVVFNRSQCIQVLDEEEATRTLAAYEQNYGGNNFAYKPFKCGMCEYRSTYISNAHSHMRHVHQVEFYEAKRLVKSLPLDEALKTVGAYNKKFVLNKDGARPKFRSNIASHKEGKTESLDCCD